MTGHKTFLFLVAMWSRGVWSRFSNYVISYTFDWLVQTVCIIWFCCLATVRKAYLCWFGLVLSSRLFFVARQQPDILCHNSHVFLGAVLVAVCTCSFVSWVLWLFYGNECTDHKVSATAATCDALSITPLVARKLLGASFSLVRKCAGKPLLQ